MTEQKLQLEILELFTKAIEENLMPTQILFALKFCEVRLKTHITELLDEHAPEHTEVWLEEADIISKINSEEALEALSKVGFLSNGEIH